MTFKSKVDTWLVLLIGASMAGVLVLPILAFVQRGLGPEVLVTGIVALALVPLMLTTFATSYTIDGRTLVVRSAMITWRVPIDEIRTITITRDPTSGPALSLDRLRIEYGTKRILVSPEDRQAFIDALRAVNPSIRQPAA